jgi:hypothetical protein
MTASAPAKSGEDPRLEAARRRVQESASEADTLEALREIVTNLLGCEEMGLFTVDRGESGLCWSFGIDPKRHATLDVFQEAQLGRVIAGECYVSRGPHGGECDPAKPPLRVFIPIRCGNRTVAVLVMLRLLPQKLDFDNADIRLAQVLSDELGKALFKSRTNATVDQPRGTI